MCFKLRVEMLRLKNYHFSLNRILLLAIGLWPYEQSKFSRFQFLFFSGILMSAIVFQLTVLLTSKCTPDLVFKVLSIVSFLIFFLIKYMMFGADVESIKELLNQFLYIYNELKDKNEIAIIEKYSYNAKRCTSALTMLTIACICAILIAEFWSDILNVILRINISRSHYLPIMTEYFIDQEKYFYLILLHLDIAICIGTTALLAIGTMLITIYVHICSIFRITSYRVEQSIKFNTMQNSTKNETLMFENIISAVDIHRRAMKLTIFMVSRFEVMYCSLIIIAVIALSLNLYRICQVASMKIDFAELMLPNLFIIALILYMFIGNDLGQDVINHSKYVFLNAYNIRWYAAPLRIQRLILFMLQRGSMDFKINIGGLFIPSLEGFSMLLNASVSYFTMIYTMR